MQRYLLFMLIILAGCGQAPITAPRPKPKAARANQSDQGLRFKLTPGASGSQLDSAKKAGTTPLSPDQLQAMLKALPPLQGDGHDAKAFALRDRSLPPPRTARTLDQPFPPASTKAPPPPVNSTRLEVTQVAPRGQVEMAPHLSITFNQPMQALSTVEQLDQKAVGVKLTPSVQGKWRWLGTQTLMFVPEVRFPMATSFQVEIPAGLKSSSGQTLSASRQESFQTPPPGLQASSPQGAGIELNPLMLLRFDQAMNTQELVARLRLTCSKGQAPTLRAATRAEILEDDSIDAQLKGQDPKRCLVVRAERALQPGTTYTVEVPAGTPSAEGPLTTRAPQTFSFSTYDPLSIQWKTEDARPLEPWTVQFNNALQSDQFKPEWVKVSPEVPDFKVRAQGSSLSMTGRWRGQSSYQVSLSPEFVDRFGQKLGHSESFTVKVGKAEPTFQPPEQAMLVLDPKGPRSLPFKVVNYDKLRVRLWKVEPSQWEAFQRYQGDYRSNLKDRRAPGQLVQDQVIQTGAATDQETEVAVDLSQALTDGLGHVVAQVEVEPPPREEWRQPYIGWVQSTQLGLDALSDHQQLVAWANDLQTGKSLTGVEFSLGGSTAVSDAQGLAHLELPQTSTPMLLARKGPDVAFLGPSDYYGGGWNRSNPSDSALWHVLDDRHLYKPDETVHIKGWVRHLQYGPKGDLQATQNHKVSYRLNDPVGNEVLKGEAGVGALGGFDFEFKLPKTVNLGYCNLSLTGDSEGSTQHGFEVQEFRRPEFEVNAEASPSTSQIGSSATVTASAAYFSGGPLANAEVNWSVSSTPTSYSPPGWDGFTFGVWTPWWPCRCWWLEESSQSLASNATSQVDHTDSKGKARLKVDFLSVDPPQPHSMTAQATVQDVNRQTWTTSTSVLVHPASLYVGLKSSRTFVEAGQPLEVEVVVSDLDGKPVKNHPVLLKAYRLDYEQAGNNHADEVELQVTSAARPVKAAIPTNKGGTYQVEAYIQDDQNRANRSQLTCWVAGGKQPPQTNVEQQQLTLVPGQREFQPGQTAEVLVQAPFAPAELMVTTRRNGVASLERLSAPDGSASLKIPLSEINIPNLLLQVDAVGSLDGRPAYATGALPLAVSSASRQLEVGVRPAQDSLQPGGSTHLQLDLKDDRKQPVQGEVTVLVVDESVLALSGYDPADPLASFCPAAAAGVSDTHSRRWLLLQRPRPGRENERFQRKTESLVAQSEADAPMTSAAPAPEAPSLSGGEAGFAVLEESKSKGQSSASADKTPAPPKNFKVRSNFDPLALFAPTVVTDNQGRAQVTVKLPDNLTRYRIIALASAGVKQFGKGESSLVARQPLMIRPSAPRFLNFGDHCRLPVMIQNQTDRPMRVALACRSRNALLGEDGKNVAGYQLEVPANDRVECQIPCRTESAGTARFQFGAAAEGASDAAEISLPVWTPASTEAFATYGVVDEGAVQQAVDKPANVWPQFGGLSVTTTSTALSELTDAFIYLAEYPYGCTEQVASRMLAAAALKDVLSAFNAPGMANQTELRRAMAADLDKLRGLQCDDGGWDYWVRNRPSIAYLTVHIAHSLVRCRQKGFEVNENMLAQALGYLQNIESHIPPDYGPECRRSIRAYALYVLDLAGTPNPQKARQLLAEASLKEQGLEVMGWLLPTLNKNKADSARVDEIYRYLDNHSTQTASTAQFNTGYGDNGYLILYSDRRDDGLLLESMIATRPKHPLIPKLVRGLLDHRQAGHWENTQENCWVLLALDRYFHQYESVTPNFVARIWLGQASAGEQTFRGRDKDEKRLVIPIDRLNGEPLTLSKSGAGRLYYRLGLDYCPRDLKQAPADYGFSVQRSYQAVRDNRDVSRDEKGVWHIKAGAEVRVNLTMQAPSRRYHVALVDPLPAGLEGVNPGLLGTRPAEPANRNDGYWSQYWYQHENMRDERVEAFTQLLWEGVYSYSYIARATTPGTFVVPPAKAEEMYHPETFGRSASDQVVVEP
ncbi:MAG: alpha-2-macroglobulin family protein [Vulcanimicrobiota bacterium]